MTPEQQVKAAVAKLPADKVKYVKNWNSKSIAGKGAFAPRFVMLHHTGGTNSLHLITRPNGEWGPVRLAHFLIARDGTVHVCASVKTYHAGKGGPKFGVASGMMNDFAWAIEIEDLGKTQTMTAAQVESAAILTAGLIDAMGQKDDHIIQHKEWSSTGKVDTRYSTTFWRDKVAATRKKVVEQMSLKAASFKVGSNYKTPLSKPLKLTARKAGYDIAIVDIPDPKKVYMLTFQARTLKGVTKPLEAEFVRLNWPGKAAEDSTGHNPFDPASKAFDVWHRWRTANHEIAGGGKVAFRVFLPEGASGAYRFVCKAIVV